MAGMNTHNKPINSAPAAPDSLHFALLRFSCRLLGRYVSMTRIVSLILILIFPSLAQGLSIRCPDRDTNFYVHSTKLNVEYVWDQDSWAVIFKAPKAISDLEFQMIQIFNNEKGIAIPLRAELIGEVVESHFYANEEFIEELSAEVFYGAPCPESFTVELKHNKARQ